MVISRSDFEKAKAALEKANVPLLNLTVYLTREELEKIVEAWYGTADEQA